MRFCRSDSWDHTRKMGSGSSAAMEIWDFLPSTVAPSPKAVAPPTLICLVSLLHLAGQSTTVRRSLVAKKGFDRFCDL